MEPRGGACRGDTVQIGPHAAAANSTVTMGVNGVAGSLTLTDGMTLQTSFGSLQVAGLTQVSGQNIVGPSTFTSQLLVQNALAGIDFQTNDLSLTNSGQVVLENDGALLVADTATLAPDTQLRGQGWGYFGGGSGATLINDGRIEASGGLLRLFQTGAGRFDLDGTNGGGVLQVHEGSRLEVNGDELLDAFNGVIEMELGTQLAMNLSNGWKLAPSGELVVTGQPSELALLAARIEGNPVELAGNMHVTGDGGSLNVASNATLTATFMAQVDAGDSLEFNGTAAVNGGAFNVAPGGSLSFAGATSLSGGVFSTSGTDPTAGLVSFYGATVWQGTITLHGRSRVADNAVVAAATTINADQFDMDGISIAGNVWDLNAPLTINAAYIESGVTNSFDGVINVSGGILNKLTINLSDPTTAWRMNGTMNLSGLSGVYFTRVAGSRMIVGGALNIANADIDVSADVVIEAGGSVNFSAAGSDLRLSGASTISKGASFSGPGLLHNNSAGGGMTVADGVSFGQAGLDNVGRLRLGDNGPGQAFVDRFVNHAAATLEVAIQGTTPGTELSHLIVTGGTATLAGTLAPSIAAEGGFFAPQAGDAFTFITAPGGIIGQFDSLIQPLGLPTGLLFEIQYTPTSVSLFVDTTYEADFDRDGDVDDADYAIWREAYGLNNYGDANGDAISDAADYTIWRSQLGAGLPMAAASAVPEPSTLLLAAAALFGLAARGSLVSSRRATVIHFSAS